MNTAVQPAAPAALAEALAAAAGAGKSICLRGNGSKRLMAGPAAPAEVVINTHCLRRVLQYEPHDLTISVEAGLPWGELSALLAQHRQMIPLDPPFADTATVGGVVAANTSGPRRRAWGSARDLIIGMTFATLEGKLVQSGGMVVKNVAGLDMAKLMIGSFGTLAAIAIVNFKVIPMPEHTETFAGSFASPDEALAHRDRVLGSVLQPLALDLLNPKAAERVGLEGWVLAVQAGGSSTVLDRYRRELRGFERYCDAQESSIWHAIREFTPSWLSDFPQGGVLRSSRKLTEVGETMRRPSGAALARAATGVVYSYAEDAAALRPAARDVIEFAPDAVRQSTVLWPEPGSDFAMMLKVKDLFDPRRLLNAGRLYGRI